MKWAHPPVWLTSAADEELIDVLFPTPIVLFSRASQGDRARSLALYRSFALSGPCTQYVGAIPTGWTTTPPVPLPKAFGMAFRKILYAPFTSALMSRPSAAQNSPRLMRFPT